MKLRPRAAAGFTLLEIILAVGIGVIFMGGAVVFLSSTGEDQKIRRAREIFEVAAGWAREQALRNGKEQRIPIGIPGEQGLVDRVIASDPEKYKDLFFPSEVEVDVITPSDLAQGRRGWARAENYQWLITGGGLVEPIRVRLRHGDNREQFEFNALTGETVTRREEQR